MSLATTFEKIAADRARYSCQVQTLGDCKIPSPVHSQEFIRDGERILSNENEALMKRLEESLGHLPTFERAGPHERIFHDPAWTRVGIVTAGGLCPGLNNVIKGLVEGLSLGYGVRPMGFWSMRTRRFREVPPAVILPCTSGTRLSSSDSSSSGVLSSR